jgi:hypothetical protein
MPRRATLTFSSDDAPTSHDLHVLYCAASGLHVLTTDLDVGAAPTRRTDGAIILNAATPGCLLKLYARDGGTVVVTRRGGRREVVTRVVVGEGEGEVQVGYRSGARPSLLYLLPDALTDAPGKQEGGAPPPPPCIVPLRGGGCSVSVAVVGGADAARVAAVSSSAVTVAVPPEAGTGAADDAVLDVARGVLGVRRSQLALQRGAGAGGAASRLLLVTGVGPPAAFDAFARAAKARREAGV